MVGHATLLVQVAGGNLLTDPVWSDGCVSKVVEILRRRSPSGLICA